MTLVIEIVSASMIWAFSGMFIWLAFADGCFFLSWCRTGQCLLLFILAGPFSLLAYPIETILNWRNNRG